jgi:hypothetical protein
VDHDEERVQQFAAYKNQEETSEDKTRNSESKLDTLTISVTYGNFDRMKSWTQTPEVPLP